MKRALMICMTAILCLSLFACGQKDLSDKDMGQSDDALKEATEISYPYEDGDGRIHHQLFINGDLVTTQHDPYTYLDNPKGTFYPIVEILDALEVECLFNESPATLTTKLNGQIITCRADNTDIVIGKTTLGGTAPEYIDGCFYVPSYTFMHLLDAVVDFTPNRSGVTITTDMVIDHGSSGTAGLSLSSQSVSRLGGALVTGADACPACGGTGKNICTFCSGLGSVTQYSQVYDPLTNQLKMQSSHVLCSRCGGSGRATCAICGGSGRR